MAGRWLSPSTPASSINKTDLHDRTEIFPKVALNTITITLSMIKGAWSVYHPNKVKRASSVYAPDKGNMIGL